MLNRLALGLVLILAACAAPLPDKAALSPEQVSRLRLAEFTVDLSDIGSRTAGREMSVADVRSALERAAGRSFNESGGGRPVRVVLDISSVNLVTAGQLMLMGGESVMRGRVSLVDIATGKPIVAPLQVEAGGGGFRGGGLVGVAMMDDRKVELIQLAERFVFVSRYALTGQ